MALGSENTEDITVKGRHSGGTGTSNLPCHCFRIWPRLVVGRPTTIMPTAVGADASNPSTCLVRLDHSPYSARSMPSLAGVTDFSNRHAMFTTKKVSIAIKHARVKNSRSIAGQIHAHATVCPLRVNARVQLLRDKYPVGTIIDCGLSTLSQQFAASIFAYPREASPLTEIDFVNSSCQIAGDDLSC